MSQEKFPDSPPAPQPVVDAVIETPELALFDKNHERSLVNLVSPYVGKKITEAYQARPDFFLMDEQTLYRNLREYEQTPTATDNRIRLKFWIEFEYCVTNHSKQIDMARVISGICSQDYFSRKYFENPGRVAWLLCPPANYTVKTEEALEFGIEQLRDILEKSHSNGGKIDVKLGELKLKIVTMLDARVKGGVVQRSMNVHAHTANAAIATSVVQTLTKPTMEELHRRLQDVRRKNLLLTNGGLNVDTVVEKEKIEQDSSE